MEAFKKLKPPFHLVFLCHETVSHEIRKIADERENIHWHPPVPHDQLINIIKASDIIIRMFDTIHLNHVYALPNIAF